MAGTESESSQTTVYRLTKPLDDKLESLIQEKYLEPEKGFTQKKIDVDGISCLLTYGVIRTEQPKWTNHVQRLTNVRPEVANQTSAGVLLIPHEDFIYALTWGMGFLLISAQFIDSGFGLRFAIRRAEARRARSVTTNAIDVIARTVKTSILGGADLDAFQIEEIGEILNRLVLSVSNKGLSCAKLGRDANVTVRGADALNVPIAKSPSKLRQDLQFIHNVVEHEPVPPELEHLESTRALRSENPVVAELNQLLEEVLAQNSTKLAISWPAEWDDERGEAMKFRFSGFGRGLNGIVEDIGLIDILDRLESFTGGHRLEALKAGKIQALNGDEDSVSRAIAANRWLTFEVDHRSQRYVYSRGTWYNVGGVYLEMLRERVSAILAKRWSGSLPLWPMEQKTKKNGDVYQGFIAEKAYNELAAKKGGSGYTCLDRKLLHTRQHPRGIESCDILGPDLELMHVKHLDDSISASHLFNQAQVSAEALYWQPDALLKMQQRVDKVSEGRRALPDSFRPSKVVFVFGGKGATPQDLFTFSQVSLVRCVQRLTPLGIKVEFVAV